MPLQCFAKAFLITLYFFTIIYAYNACSLFKDVLTWIQIE